MKSLDTERTSQLGEALVVGAFSSLGFAVRRQNELDYGIDYHAELIENGRPTGRLLALQVKSGPSYFERTEGDSFVFPYEARHHDYWIVHSLPVVVCLCNVDQRAVYWQVISEETAAITGKGFKVRVPKNQIVDQESSQALREMLTPIDPANGYTILEESDTSFGIVSRCSVKMLPNVPVTKSQLGVMVRQATLGGVVKRVCSRSSLPGVGKWPGMTPLSWHNGSPLRATA